MYKSGKICSLQSRILVIGGGPAGICAAIAAAREGADTILINNRPVLGGNSSSEVRVWTRGATGGGSLFAEEMGIWGELKLRNLYANPEGNPVFWDETLLDGIYREKGIRLLENTQMVGVEMDEDRVTAIEAVQLGTEKHFRIQAEVDVDATGDGSLGQLAGVDQLLRGIWGKTAHDLLSLSQIVFQPGSWILTGVLQQSQIFHQISHGCLPPYSAS